MEKQAAAGQYAQTLQTTQNLEDETDMGNDVLDEELTGDDSFSLLPLFEKEMFNRRFIKQYSMNNNKTLYCGWQRFKSDLNKRSGPFQMPNNNDLHFHNQMVKFYPASSIENQDHRKKMKPGPGVDLYGQKPTPNDLFMKRGNKIDVTEKQTKIQARTVKPSKLTEKPARDSQQAAGKNAGKGKQSKPIM